MMKCQLCNKQWPERFIQTLFTRFGNVGADPICGLHEIRKIHGDPTLEFSGENNKRLLAEAIKRQEATCQK